MAHVIVQNDPDNSRYTARVDGELAGFTEYEMLQGRHVFFHTETDPSYAGKGVGSTLVKEALDDVRAGGGTIVPLCPFVAAFVRRHPDYRDLVDRELWKQIRKGSSPDE
jgi:predicted GNAT family acetyltransferase